MKAFIATLLDAFNKNLIEMYVKGAFKKVSFKCKGFFFKV